MKQCHLLAVAGLFFQLASSSERRFDVKDDIFAYPQYDVSFPPSYVLREDAEAKLASNQASPSPSAADNGEGYRYEYVVGNKRPYLCTIPQVTPVPTSPTEEDAGVMSQTDLVAAANRGGQLLSDMEGQQCLYYRTGWWTYAFCYNDYVKQYHAIQTPPHSSQWPPPEDPGVESYFLGKHDAKAAPKAQGKGDAPEKEAAAAKQKSDSNELSLQTTQEQNSYLTHTLGNGTPCDLTGTPRVIEVQYHCSPGTPDRIGWIKETATCSYQMVVYTSRLCSDVAFQPPKEAKVYEMTCEEILSSIADVEDWKQFRATHSNPEIRQGIDGVVVEEPAGSNNEVAESQQQYPMVGKIRIGSRTMLGPNAKALQKGRIVMTAAEIAALDALDGGGNSGGQQAQVVVIRKDGKLQMLTKEDMKKLKLNPAEVDGFVKEMQKFAGDKDFKIERQVKKQPGPDTDGIVELMGIVDEDEETEDADKAGEEQGSTEEFKQEL